MSRPRFLADHDLDERIVEGVERREPAVEFLRVRELGLDQAADDVILDYAGRHELIVVSHDVNTMSAAAASRLVKRQAMNGLILAHQFRPIRGIIDDLILIWAASEAEEWVDQIRFLPL